MLEATAYNSLVAVEKVGHSHTKVKTKIRCGKLPWLNVVLRDTAAEQ